MTQMRQAPGAGQASGGSSEVMSATSSDATRFPLAWHDQADWEGQHQYGEGYRDGYAAGWAAAEQAIADEITRAVGVQPYGRRDVIRGLIAGIGRIPEPYSSRANGTGLGVAERDAIGRAA